MPFIKICKALVYKMPYGPQSPPSVGVDLLSKSFSPPNITFAGTTPFFGSGGGGGSGVSNINAVSGAINLQSTDGSVLITETGQDINLSVNFPLPAIPTTLDGLSGAITLASSDATISISQVGQQIRLGTVNIVDNIQAGATTVSGNAKLQSAGGTVLFSPGSVANSINLESVAIAGVDTLNGVTGIISLTSPNSTVAIAVSGQTIQLETVSGGPANILAGTDITITATEPLVSVSPATISVLATGGSGGNIGIQSYPGGAGQSGGQIALISVGGSGIGGTFGQIDLTAQPGTDAASGITTGGLISINANTGLSVGSLCSIIRQQSASIQSFAGAIPGIPSATPGFQTIYGNQGISLTAGLPAVLPQVPFTIYQYASLGISLDSDVYTNQMYPYWDGLGAVPDLTISGRILPSASYVVLEDVKSIDMASIGTITGVVSINGSAYPPASAVAVNSLNGLSGVVTLSAGANITLTPTGNDIAISATNAPAPVLQATYYKTAQQNLVNGDTDISFDAVASWNNDAGYINHVPGSIDFSVVGAGLYSLEFNISINANGATWNNSVNKSVSIDITRIGIPEVAVIQDSGMKQTGLSYQQTVASSYYLQVGDIINLRNTLAYASATPFAVGLQNTFDLNTFFTWRYITA